MTGYGEQLSSAPWLEFYQHDASEINQHFADAAKPLEFYRLGVVTYSYRDLVRRIQAKVDEAALAGVAPKAIQDAIGMSKDQWSRKMKLNADGTGGTKTSWNLEELTRIANHFDAPPGWPFIEWSIADANQRALAALAELRREAGDLSPPRRASSGQEVGTAQPRRRSRAGK